MSQEQPSRLRRIEILEKKLAKVESLLANERRNRISRIPQIRLAETINSGSVYPESANTFPVRFIDPSFTEEEGNQSLTVDLQDDTHQRIARTIPATQVAEGTQVFVVEIDGQHYIIPPPGGGSESSCDVCALVELVEELHTLTTAQQEKASAIKASCGCQGCDGVTGGTPQTVTVRIAGLTATVNGVTGLIDFNGERTLTKVDTAIYIDPPAATDENFTFEGTYDIGGGQQANKYCLWESEKFSLKWPNTGASTYEGKILLVSDNVNQDWALLLISRLLTTPNYADNRVYNGDFVAMGPTYPLSISSNQVFSWEMTMPPPLPAQRFFIKSVNWSNLSTGGSGFVTINDGVAAVEINP